MRIYTFNIDNMLAKKLFYSLKSRSASYIVPTIDVDKLNSVFFILQSL